MSPSNRLAEETKITVKHSIAECSACGVEFTWTWAKHPKFCPMCGRQNGGQNDRSA